MTDDARLCATCGGELVDGRCNQCANRAVSKIVRLDAARLLALATICVACFLGTRAVAKLDRANDLAQAAAAYRKAQQEQISGDQAHAVQDFRNATIHDRNNPRYSLALAEALSASGQEDEALQLLLKTREDNPEDPEINSQIARAEAKRNDLSDAELYYQHALYGIWQGDNADRRRRQIRLEFIQFLSQHGRHDAAMSELLALQAEAPKDPVVAIQVAGLELNMGEAKSAQAEYEQALRNDKHNPEALAGLALADFRLGQFAAATRTLNAAETETSSLPADATRLKLQLQWIADHDPDKRGLSRNERQDLMNQDLTQVLQHVRACEATKPAADKRARLQQMETELTTFQNSFNANIASSLQDALQDGFDVIRRAEELTGGQCAPSDADTALLALSRTKGVSER